MASIFLRFDAEGASRKCQSSVYSDSKEQARLTAEAKIASYKFFVEKTKDSGVKEFLLSDNSSSEEMEATLLALRGFYKDKEFALFKGQSLRSGFGDKNKHNRLTISSLCWQKRDLLFVRLRKTASDGATAGYELQLRLVDKEWQIETEKMEFITRVGNRPLTVVGL
ncbi:MAG: hypothetical protein AB7K68_00720 [Bacteriovoracia bacterium]